MAKKNLQDLMSGILGESVTQPQYAPTVLEQAIAQLDEEQKPKEAVSKKETPVKSKSKINESKKRRESGEQISETRATFFIADDLLKKLKYIALIDSAKQKDIINAGLRRHIDEWERKNHKINIP